MINSQMKTYYYFTLDSEFTYGDETKGLVTVKSEYGEEVLSKIPLGKIKMAIYVSSQSVQNNILYQGCQYVGLTFDKNIDDSYVIDYEGKKLKVLYTNKQGKYTQVYMSNYE